MQVRSIGFGDVKVSELKKGTILKPDGNIPLSNTNRHIVDVIDLPGGIRQVEAKYPGSSETVRINFNKDEILEGFDIVDKIKNAARRLVTKSKH